MPASQFSLTLISAWVLALGRWELRSAWSGKEVLPGVTSLIRAPSCSDQQNGFLAGTKRGQVLRLTLEGDGLVLEGALGVEGQTETTSFPIFSMAMDVESSELFCGGGDRYVSVWGVQVGTMSQRLGPHTGWAKDVLWNRFSGELYSIGCNCIETWRRAPGDADDTRTRRPFQHARKLSIESSPDMGSTLSSDLLCLCGGSNGVVFAGGVDGRIHIWNATAPQNEPVLSVAAHAGRVNALTFVAAATGGGLLFSGSHDGRIRCWEVSESPLSIAPVAQLELGDARVTSFGLLLDRSADLESASRTVKLFYGTHRGQVGVVSTGTLPGGKLGLLSASNFTLPGEPIVNALVVIVKKAIASRKKCYQIVVGHSDSISLLNYEQ